MVQERVEVVSDGVPAEPAAWSRFGKSIAGSRWFNGVPSVSMEGGEVVWSCPTRCGGHMHHSGDTWLTASPGYHHTCTKCGFTAAIRGATFERRE